MAIISRQIGWGTESNLLYQILKQLNRLTSIMFGLKPKYKVYTALLTQSGGDNKVTLNNEFLTIGVTYVIDNNEEGTADFTNIGAPNNNVDTFFIATGTTPNSWGITNLAELTYNTGAPVVTVLENTIGNIWFEYVNSGQYRLSSEGLFIEGKSWCMPAILLSNYDTNFFEGHIGRSDENRYRIFTSENGTLEDNLLSETPIEIRVYN